MRIVFTDPAVDQHHLLQSGRVQYTSAMLMMSRASLAMSVQAERTRLNTRRLTYIAPPEN